jgi:hypothetical protein
LPRPNAIDAARKFRIELAQMEAQAAERMGRIYARIYTSLSDDVNAYADRLATLEKITPGQAIKLARARAIVEQVREQAGRFSVTVENEVMNVQSLAIQKGIDDAMQLMTLSLPPLPGDVQRQVVGSFARLHPDAIEAAAGLVGADSPLTERLQVAYGDFVAQQVEEKLLTGIAAGQNPRVIARILSRNVQDGMGIGLNSALTTVRTAQIKSYQIANHATYLANSDIVPGWIWWAELGTACMSCVAMHGTKHSNTETLDDHHNGRCAPIPETITYRQLGLNIDEPTDEPESGEDWFNRQSEATQREMMGAEKYEAWKGGKFDFRALTVKYDDAVYGELLREASLKELLR